MRRPNQDCARLLFLCYPRRSYHSKTRAGLLESANSIFKHTLIFKLELGSRHCSCISHNHLLVSLSPDWEYPIRRKITQPCVPRVRRFADRFSATSAAEHANRLQAQHQPRQLSRAPRPHTRSSRSQESSIQQARCPARQQYALSRQVSDFRVAYLARLWRFSVEWQRFARYGASSFRSWHGSLASAREKTGPTRRQPAFP